MSFDEAGFLDLLRARSRDHGASGLLVGIGDDAAVLAGGERQVAVTTDMLLDGIDFELERCGYRSAGRKAMGKSLSDLAAMGVEPWCAFTSVALPPDARATDAGLLLDGLLEWQDICPLAGGDTKRSSGPLVLNVAMTGRTAGRAPVLRSGARPGDILCVTGRLGGAGASHHLDFMPRWKEGLLLNLRYHCHAMIDLSDGLALDLRRMCTASGVGARIDGAKLPLASGAHEAAAGDGRPALHHALGDGEDYELLVALAPEQADLALEHWEEGQAGAMAAVTVVGRCTPRGRGLVLRTSRGDQKLPEVGFEHHFGRRPEA